MNVGIYNAMKAPAAVPVTSSAVLVTSGLVAPIAANQTAIIEALLQFSVGATGGFRTRVVVPAAGTLFGVGFLLANTVAPGVVVAEQVASAAFNNAVANAGNHWCRIFGTVVNGANAGDIDIQVAQDTSDVLTMTLLASSWLKVVYL